MLVQLNATVGGNGPGTTPLFRRAWRLRLQYELGHRSTVRGSNTRSYFQSVRAWEKEADSHLDPASDMYPQPIGSDNPIFVSAEQKFTDLFPKMEEEPAVEISDLAREEINLRPASGDPSWMEKNTGKAAVPVTGLGDVLYYPQRSGMRTPTVPASVNLDLECYVWILLPLHSDEGTPALFKKTMFSFRDVRKRMENAHTERQRQRRLERARHEHENRG